MDDMLLGRVKAGTDISGHLTTLYMLVKEKQLHQILELGTKTGESTVAFLAAARDIGGHVYSIDRDPCPVAEERIRALGLRGYWTFLQEDDMDTFWRSPIDMLFVDTCHEYRHTLAELAKYEPFVKTNGVVAMHDPVHDPPVRQAAMEYFGNRADVRIYEWCHNNGLLVIFK